LCLESLEKLALTDLTVLDVGTGSGILAIAAALRGARAVDALDIDEVSVQVALDNVALNGVGDRVSVARGTLHGSDTTLVFANILAEVIIALAHALADALAAGGTLVASGIIGDKGDMVTDALTAAGLVVAERREENDWLALIAHKP